MTNEYNPNSRVSEKRLRFIFTEERDRWEELTLAASSAFV